MVAKWCEGFETHQNLTQLQRKYATCTGGIAAGAGRAFGSSGGPISLVAVTPSLGLSDTLILGFGLRISSQQTALNSGAQGFYFERGANEQCHIEFVNNAGSFEIRLLRGSTTLATTSSAFAYGVWHHFEISVTIHPSTGAYELRHNEVSVSSGSSLNTANTGSSQADVLAIRFVSNVSTAVLLDDINLKDTTGATANDFVGDLAIEGITPNAVGTTTQWTNDAGSGSNWENVDDAGSAAPDESGVGGTNSSDTSGQKDTYNFSDLTQIDGDIVFIQISTQLAMAAAGSRDVEIVYRDDGGTEAVADTVTVASTAYDDFQVVLDQNPATATDWDVDDINNGEFGVEVV